jgi:hypothetical protein
VGTWSITCESYCVIKVGFVVPDVAFECTDIPKQLSVKIFRDEDRSEWEQNVKRCVSLRRASWVTSCDCLVQHMHISYILASVRHWDRE